MLSRLKQYVRKGLSSVGVDVRRSQKDPYRLAVYQALYSEDVLQKRPFYNVGSGAFYHPCWTNIDYKSDWYGEFQQSVVHHDLMSLSPLPIGDEQAKIIYTSHTIEHVKDEAVAVLFRESYRALERGGVMRVTTGPDAETDYRAMLAGDTDWFYWDRWYSKPGTYEKLFNAPADSVPIEERWLHHVATQLAPNARQDSPLKLNAADVRRLLADKGLEATLDYLTGQCPFRPDFPGNHVSWWTHAKVERFLREAGFTNVYRSGHQQSAAAVMRCSDQFDSTHPQMSLYVEAIKS